MIDCGGFEKLERYGKYILRRPEPKAIWHKSMPDNHWERTAHATFQHCQAERSNPDERGTWTTTKNMPSQWFITYNHAGLNLRLRLALTAFKHVGIFPEQASNWDCIFGHCHALNKPKVLNLFAYTGAASLAACAASADVTHLDAVRQVVSWANENMQQSAMSGIRWLVDDALKFVQRQARKHAKYDVIILDPPAYGRGPQGERWLLQQGLLPLLEAVRAIAAEHAFVVLNLYALGVCAIATHTLMQTIFPNAMKIESHDLGIVDRFGKQLPLSVAAKCYL